MAIRKRTISFDAEVLAEAERLSAERGCTLSAFVNAAVEHRLKVARGLPPMEDDIERFGRIPESVVGGAEAL